MPAGAVSHRATDAAPDILKLRHRLEVVGVDALSIAAEVVQVLVFRKRLAEVSVGDSVSLEPSTKESEPTIARVRAVAIPVPTIAFSGC